MQWRPTARQLELRLDRVTRRHIKLSDGTCAAESGTDAVVFGTAHTDRYDLRRCGGDYVVDVDHARDDLVAALVHGAPGRTATYSIAAPRTYSLGGCETALATDGRVAYVTVH